MTICGKKKQEELDEILRKTKFSSRTKALATYYSSGITPKIDELFATIFGANIPLSDVKPLTLILYDAYRNGCSKIAGHNGRGGAHIWKKKIEEDTDFICMVHSKTRKNTLKIWKEAIYLIDNNKERRGRWRRN